MKMKLSDLQFDFWNNHSYLVLNGIFSSQVVNLSLWLDEIAAWPENPNKWLRFYEMEDERKLSRVENFAPFHPQVNQIINGEEILSVVSQLMGEEAILYKERINFKPPGGGAHAAHQDGVAYESGGQRTFEKDSVPYISLLICVDAAAKKNGCLELASDWPIDKLDILPMERPYQNHPNFSKITQQVEDQIDWLSLEMKPGDVVFFTERIPHRSAKNRSETGRRILYGVYNPLSEGDKRQQYFDDKRKNINDARYMVGNPHAPSKQ